MKYAGQTGPKNLIFGMQNDEFVKFVQILPGSKMYIQPFRLMEQ
jgi:hypothetical protein